MVLRSIISEEQRENIEGIYASGQTLLKIINDILDLSKIEAGRLTICFEATDLHRLVEEVISITAVNARPGVEVRLERGRNLPNFIYTDKTRLQQILTNLVGNAVKFTRKGHVLLALASGGEYGPGETAAIHFRIEDTGPGIHAAKIREVFNPFCQADNSISREYGGTGLGLSISQRMVKLLGGDDIDLASVVGTGSVFSFTLPMQVAAGPTTDVIPAPAQNHRFQQASQVRILAAEDWELNRVLLGQILGDLGFTTVTFVSNGQEAIDAVRTADPPFDLILMDLQMPVMGGIEATRIIRLDDPEVPILAVTAHAMKEDQQQCLAAGMNDYLSKPYKIEEIIHALQRALG
jgi:CheY-like chemotaxis protein